MFFFRADANENIGTGHIMRCLAIADEAKNMGEESTFIVADEKGKRIVESKGYLTIVLNSKWNDLNQEIELMLDVIEFNHIHTVILDTYFVTQKYLDMLKKKVKLVYFDDLYTSVCPFSLLINYAVYSEKFSYTERYETSNLALGSRYIPLRKAFQNIPPKLISEKVTNILLMSGGTDSYSFILGFLRYIEEKKLYQGTRFVIICGRYNQDKDQITKLAEKHDDFILYENVDDIEKYMMEADVAISAGGTTLYELCACGTPTITYSMADNQMDNVQGFAEKKMMLYSGDIRKDFDYENIKKMIDKLIVDVNLRREISEKCQRLVDGNGAKRIIDRIIKIHQEGTIEGSSL